MRYEFKFISVLMAIALVFTSSCIFIPTIRAANDTITKDTITVDKSKIYQQIMGFGATGNTSATEFVTELTSDTQDKVAKFLYGTGKDDIGLSIFRMGIEPSVVPNLDAYNSGVSIWNWNANFEADDANMVQQIKKWYPDLAVFAVPWSPPSWMKDGLVNPGFESGDTTGWTVGPVGEVTIDNPYKDSTHKDSTHAFHTYSSNSYTTYIEQTETFVQNTKLDLAAKISGDADLFSSVKLSVFVNNESTASWSKDITSLINSGYQSFGTTGIQVPTKTGTYPVKVRLDIDAKPGANLYLDEFNLNAGIPTKNGSLRNDRYNIFADYLYQWTKYSIDERKIPIKYLSTQNEPNAIVNWDSCYYTPKQLNDETVLVADKIHTSDLNGIVKVAGPEYGSDKFAQPYFDAMQAGGALEKLDLIAGHNYNVINNPAIETDWRKYNKPYLMSEVSDGTGNYNDSMTDALTWAGQINFSLTHGEGGFMYWWLTSNTSKDKQLIKIDSPTTYEVPKRTYVFGQYSRFMRPGDNVIDTSTSSSSLHVAASKNSSGQAALVVTNPTSAPITATISGLEKGVSVTQTSETQSLEAQPEIYFTDKFDYTFPANSVTTFQDMIDNTAPVIQKPTQLEFMQTDLSDIIPVNAVDQISGVKSVFGSVNGGTAGNPVIIKPLIMDVGDYNLTIQATDRVGNSSEQTFVIKVIIDVDHLGLLLNEGAQNGWITNHGVLNSLQSKVDALVRDRGDPEKFANDLNTLQHEIIAQAGKKISREFAARLTGDISFLGR